MNRTDHDPGKREQAAERRVKAFELRKRGASFRAIGKELGVSEAQAHRDVMAMLTQLADLERATAEEYRALELARLDDLAVAAAKVLLTTHPYVSGGKVLDGVLDDGPKLAAIDKLIRISESRRKLLGLDAPTKTALTNPDGTPYETQQRMIGVVLNLLAPYPDLRLALAAQLTEETDATGNVQD